MVGYDGPLPEPIPVPEASTVRHLDEVDPEPARSGDEAQNQPIVLSQRNFTFVPGRVGDLRPGDSLAEGGPVRSTGGGGAADGRQGRPGGPEGRSVGPGFHGWGSSVRNQCSV